MPTGKGVSLRSSHRFHALHAISADSAIATARSACHFFTRAWYTRRMDAVVLLSGGLDSTTALAIARSRGFACHALTVRYGQLHEVEIDAARRVAAALGA